MSITQKLQNISSYSIHLGPNSLTIVSQSYDIFGNKIISKHLVNSQNILRPIL